jgi:hypothetical protein
MPGADATPAPGNKQYISGNIEPYLAGPELSYLRTFRRFYDAGFQTLGGHVDLTMDLARRHHRWLTDARLHGLDFRY